MRIRKNEDGLRIWMEHVIWDEDEEKGVLRCGRYGCEYKDAMFSLACNFRVSESEPA